MTTGQQTSMTGTGGAATNRAEQTQLRGGAVRELEAMAAALVVALVGGSGACVNRQFQRRGRGQLR